MKSVNYNSGYKTYALNGDESNVIRINVSDVNILKRVKEVQDFMSALEDEKPTPERLVELDEIVREKINYVFGADVSSAAFGETNCFSPVDDGRFLFQAFLEALIPAISEDIKAKAKPNENVKKYVDRAKKKSSAPKTSIDLENLTAEQKALLSAVLEANGV